MISCVIRLWKLRQRIHGYYRMELGTSRIVGPRAIFLLSLSTFKSGPSYIHMRRHTYKPPNAISTSFKQPFFFFFFLDVSTRVQDP